MANYGATSFALSWNSNDITAYIETVNGFEVERAIDDIASVAAENPDLFDTGFEEGKDLVLTGAFNDAGEAADGDTLANFPRGAKHTAVMTWGGSSTTTSDFMVSNVKLTPVKKKATRFSVTLKQTGPIT